MRNSSLVLGGILTLTAAAAAVVGGFWTPYDPLRPEVAPAYAPPSPAHPFGADWFGRDVLSRVLAAAPVGMRIALLGILVGGAAGILLGGLSGFYGGVWGEVIEGILSGILAFPPLLLALLLVAVLGPGEGSVIAAIALFNVPYFGRIVRANVLELRGRAFVEAARACGAGGIRIVLVHLLPNALGPLVVQATSSLGFALLSEAALSYLGLGTQPPHPSWGRMLKEAQTHFSRAPWTAVFPGLSLTLAVLGFNLLGDGLQARLAPNRRGRV